MEWYRVVKTIRGRRYVYMQKTRREGKHVRTENRYVGPERRAAKVTGHHGTFEKFDGFDRAFLGSNTGSKGSFEGFFFASNRNVAVSYASTEVAKTRGLQSARASAISKLEALTGRAYELAGSVLDSLDRGEYSGVPDFESKVLTYLGAIQRAEARLEEIGDWMDDGDLVQSKRAAVLKRELRMERPYVHDMLGKPYDHDAFAEIIRKAKADGCDGVVVRNTFDQGSFAVADEEEGSDQTDVYVVFDASQVEESSDDL